MANPAALAMVQRRIHVLPVARGAAASLAVAAASIL
jgi:hypothetical protein